MITTFRQTSDFGAVESVRKGAHTGIDLAMEIGTPLRSVMDGWISKVLDGTTSLGKGVIIKGLDGREYIYGHMDSVALKVGDAVKYGSFIGESGNTGNSTGPHLHFAIKENGQYVDPSAYKTMLDRITGDITNANWQLDGPSNTRQELEICMQDNAAWYDIEGKLQATTDKIACETKLQIYGFLKGLTESVAELSYTVALIGGGILIVLRVCGMTRATKYFTVLQASHFLIRATLGGIR